MAVAAIPFLRRDRRPDGIDPYARHASIGDPADVAGPGPDAVAVALELERALGGWVAPQQPAAADIESLLDHPRRGFGS